MSHARRYAVWPDPRSTSRSRAYSRIKDRKSPIKGSRPSVPHGTNFFVMGLLVTHPKSYIETTDHHDFGGKPSKWRWGIPEFCSVGGARSQNSIFRVFRLGYPSTVLCTAYRKQFYPKPMIPVESRDSGSVPFAGVESLWPGIWQI